MSKRFRMSTALDVDDLLLECIPYAIKLANEKYHFDPPLSIHEVNKWGKLDSRADVIFEFFKDPEFFRNQPVIKGAKEFVRKLSELTEVYIATSIYPQFMGIRAEKILKEFPEIPENHIFMGSSKELINVDILFDDGMHNVFKSNAAYPILMRRPWNQNATGMLAVNTYDEFLKLVDVITKSYSFKAGKLQEPGIVVLIGPSGACKNEVAEELIKTTPNLKKLISYTTVDKKEKKDNWYKYITINEFNQMLDNGELFESTMYAGHGYGSKKADVDVLLNQGNNIIAVMDICGAMSLKTNYDNVATIYLKRDKRFLLNDILEKDITTEEKVSRIISIDDERRNAEICDYEVEYTTKEEAAETIKKLLQI